MERKIYNQNYYKIQIMIKNPKFKKNINKLIKSFDRFDCSIPKEGFKSEEEYLAWNDKYFAKRSKIINGKEYKEKLKKVIGDKKKWNSEEQEQIEKIKEKELPPVYGEEIRKILSLFNIMRKDKDYKKIRNFIIGYIFFNKKEYSEPLCELHMKKNEKTRELELLLRIMPYTKKEDITISWPLIKEAQQDLAQYKERNKPFKNFERDVEIYHLYKKLRKNKKYKKGKGENIYYNNRADQEVCSFVYDKYGDDLSWEAIRKIVSNIDKLMKCL